MRTLADWESTLALQVADGEVLLGQLPLNAAPYDENDMHGLGALLREVFAGHDFRDALALIKKKYPLSYALYLVLHGIYSYSSGEFWPAPGNDLQIMDNHYWSHHCGKTFRAILHQFNLPTFEHINGLVNLVPILAHGGIPNNSLNDFFRLLHRSVRGNIIALDAETLIDDWSLKPEETFYFIDKPVERFLLYGDEVAIDFLDRCLAMVEAESEDEMADLGLSQRVVAQYCDWRIGQTDQQLRKAQIHLARPFLYLDPYSAEGVCLALPPQKFSSAISLSKLDWVLTFDGQTKREILTERNRIEGGYEYTVPEIVPLPVREEYNILLRKDAVNLKIWILHGLSEEQFWQFDPDTGEMFNRWSQDQPGERWILYHNKFDLQVEDGVKTAELPQQYGEWGQYVIEAWTLNPGGKVALVFNDVTVHEIQVTEAKALRKPCFLGGIQPLDQQLRSKTPLYSGRPPRLVISSAQEDAGTQLSRWHITIRGDGDTRPDQRKSVSLNELEESALHFDDYQVAVDLSSPKLLGSSPCGTFEIFASGPYGRGRRLGLRIVPLLEVSGHQRLYLSYDEGPAQFQMTCGEGSQIKAITSEGVNCVPQSDHQNQYQVQSEPSVQAVQLVYIDHEGIRVPFSLRVRRPRWALWQSSAPDDFLWQTNLLSIHPESLADAYEARLLVDLPTIVGSSALYAGWRLLNPDGVVMSSREPDMIRSQQQFTIRLGELFAIYRLSQQKGESLLLQLWIRHPQSDDLIDSFVGMLSMIPHLDLGHVETSCLAADSQLQLSLSWESKQVVEKLSLFLWPADQPWIDQYLYREIECQESCKATIEIDRNQLPGVGAYKGAYVGQLAIVDPWSGVTPLPPGISQHPQILFVPNSADEYYDGISTSKAPEETLTALVYQFRVDHHGAIHTPNQRLRELARQGNLSAEMMVAWANVVREVNNPVAYKLVKWTLFDHAVLKKMENELVQGQLLNNYLEHVPKVLPSTKSYLQLLEAGYPQVRQQCISALCKRDEKVGIDELLEDVQSAKITVLDAAKLIEPAGDFVLDYLLELGSIDAMDLLTHVIKANGKPPQWIEPGFLVDTDYFTGRVLDLEGGKKLGSKSFCKLEDDVKIEVILEPECDRLVAKIDPAGKLVYFETTQPLYQCVRCRGISASHDSFLHYHFREKHPKATSPSFTIHREKRVFRIKQITARFSN